MGSGLLWLGLRNILWNSLRLSSAGLAEHFIIIFIVNFLALYIIFEAVFIKSSLFVPYRLRKTALYFEGKRL